MSPIPSTRLDWSKALTLEPYQTLQTYQVQKVAAVALASILLFGVQWSCSWTLVAGVTLLCSVTTLLSEALLRRNDKAAFDWMNTDFDKKNLMMQVAVRLSIVPIVMSLITAFWFSPLQTVATEILNGNLRMILLATLVAPIAEEIIFRGFLQERLEDAAVLIDRDIHPLSEKTKKNLTTNIQPLIFGAIHIVGGQVGNGIFQTIVFLQTSLLGYLFTHWKEEDRSLLTPLAVHASQNTGATLGLLLSKLLTRS